MFDPKSEKRLKKKAKLVRQINILLKGFHVIFDLNDQDWLDEVIIETLKEAGLYRLWNQKKKLDV